MIRTSATGLAGTPSRYLTRSESVPRGTATTRAGNKSVSCSLLLRYRLLLVEKYGAAIIEPAVKSMLKQNVLKRFNFTLRD